jgi:hypothetical protein
MTPNQKPEQETTPDDPGPGALLLSTPPLPPPPSTIRVLIPHGCAWTARDVPGATQVDVTLTPRPRRQGGRR